MLTEKTYHHGNLKDALVKASLDILHKDGLAGLSLRKCAERVGVSHTAPKNHFGNMAGLLTALASAGYAMLADYMRKNWAESTPRRAPRFSSAGLCRLCCRPSRSVRVDVRAWPHKKR
jgi:AcrR family transcriptional regulator